METLIDFLLNNYIWVLIGILIIIFALIGYLVDNDSSKVKKNKNEVKPIVKVDDEEKFEVHPSMEVYTNEDFDEPLIK